MSSPPTSNVYNRCDSCEFSSGSIPTVIDVAIQFVNQTLSLSRLANGETFPYYCFANVPLYVDLSDGFKIDLITMRNEAGRLAIDYLYVYKLEPQTATEPATIPFDPYLQSAGNLSEIVYLPDLSFDPSEIAAGSHNYQLIGTTIRDGSIFKMATAMDTEGSLLSMANVPNMATSLRIEVTFQLDSASLYNSSSHLKLCILLLEESLLPVNIFEVTDNSSVLDGFQGAAMTLMFAPYNMFGSFIFSSTPMATFNTSYTVMSCDLANSYDPTWFADRTVLTIQIYEDLMTVAMTTSQGPQFFTLASNHHVDGFQNFIATQNVKLQITGQNQLATSNHFVQKVKVFQLPDTVNALMTTSTTSTTTTTTSTTTTAATFAQVSSEEEFPIPEPDVGNAVPLVSVNDILQCHYRSVLQSRDRI